MQEIYEELLGHLRENPVISEYLEGEVPDFSEIWTQAMPMLSSGEKIMVEVALALYNGNGVAKISDIYAVDDENKGRILRALALRFGQQQS